TAPSLPVESPVDVRGSCRAPARADARPAARRSARSAARSLAAVEEPECGHACPRYFRSAWTAERPSVVWAPDSARFHLAEGAQARAWARLAEAVSRPRRGRVNPCRSGRRADWAEVGSSAPGVPG